MEAGVTGSPESLGRSGYSGLLASRLHGDQWVGGVGGGGGSGGPPEFH